MTSEWNRAIDSLVVLALLLGGAASPLFARADGSESGTGSLPEHCESDHDGACVGLDLRQEARRKGGANSGSAQSAKRPDSLRQPTSSSHPARSTTPHGSTAPSAAKRCEGRVVKGQCVLDFADDKLDGSSNGQKIARIDALTKPKTDLCSFEREEAYRLVKEGRDSSQAEEKLMECYERVRQVSIQLDQDVSLSTQCPKDFNDVDALRELQGSYDAAPKSVGLSELVVFPLNPDSSWIEPHLPYACGYNQSSQTWFRKVAFHCTDDRHCYSQSHREAPLNKTLFEPIQAEINLWEATRDEFGTRGYRDGGLVGDLRIIKLSDGRYLQTYRNGSGIYYFGLIFVPSQRTYLEKACELETSRAAPGQEITQLVVRGDILAETKEVTARLARDFGMPESEKKALRERASSLMAMLEGTEKATITDEKLGESACARLHALSGRTATKAVPRKASRDKLMDEILGATDAKAPRSKQGDRSREAR